MNSKSPDHPGWLPVNPQFHEVVEPLLLEKIGDPLQAIQQLSPGQALIVHALLDVRRQLAYLECGIDKLFHEVDSVRVHNSERSEDLIRRLGILAEELQSGR